MGHLATGDITRYQKGKYQPQFTTLEEHIKEASWGYTWKISIFTNKEPLRRDKTS